MTNLNFTCGFNFVNVKEGMAEMMGFGVKTTWNIVCNGATVGNVSLNYFKVTESSPLLSQRPWNITFIQISQLQSTTSTRECYFRLYKFTFYKASEWVQ